MPNDELIAYFDSDGVLADMRGFMDAHGIPYNKHGERDRSVDQRMWDQLRQIPHFYAKFEELDGVEVLNNLKAMGVHCEVLTAVPREKWNIPTAAEDKIQWGSEHLEDTKINIVYRADKKDFATDRYKVLIDDLSVNVREWNEAGGTAIKFTGAKAFDYNVIKGLMNELEQKKQGNAYNKLAEMAGKDIEMHEEEEITL